MHPNDRLCLRRTGFALLVRYWCAHVKSADRNSSSGERSGLKKKTQALSLDSLTQVHVWYGKRDELTDEESPLKFPTFNCVKGLLSGLEQEQIQNINQLL